MNCDGIRGLLSAYLDGELSPGDLLRVEQHLRRCHWCADEVDALRQAVSLVASLEEVEVPPTFHANLHERLVALGPPAAAVRRLPAARPRPAHRWFVPAAAAAAALAIGLTAYQTMGPSLTPGLVAEGQFTLPQQGTQEEPAAKSNQAQPQAANSGGTVAQAPNTSNDPGSQPKANGPETYTSAPVGTPQTDPRQAGVATGPTDIRATGTNLQALSYYEYELTVPKAAGDKLAALQTKYTGEEQNGAWLFKFAVAQLPDRLKEFEALPGASVVRRTETNIAQEIADATEKYQASQDAYAKLQKELDTKVPADPTAAKAQLDAYRSRADEDKASLELLKKLLETGTIIVRVE